MTQLTNKQQAFVNEYIKDWNASAAYLRAGYANSGGYKINALKLLYKDYVQQAIEAKKAELQEKTAITIAYIQAEHERLARLAEQKGDLATATRNKELAGKTVGAYVERVRAEQGEKERQLTEKEQAEARRLASIRLAEVVNQGKKRA